MNIVGCQNPNCKTGRPGTLVIKVPVQMGAIVELKPLVMCAPCALIKYKEQAKSQPKK